MSQFSGQCPAAAHDHGTAGHGHGGRDGSPGPARQRTVELRQRARGARRYSMMASHHGIPALPRLPGSPTPGSSQMGSLAGTSRTSGAHAPTGAPLRRTGQTGGCALSATRWLVPDGRPPQVRWLAEFTGQGRTAWAPLWIGLNHSGPAIIGIASARGAPALEWAGVLEARHGHERAVPPRVARGGQVCEWGRGARCRALTGPRVGDWSASEGRRCLRWQKCHGRGRLCGRERRGGDGGIGPGGCCHARGPGSKRQLPSSLVPRVPGIGGVVQGR